MKRVVFSDMTHRRLTLLRDKYFQSSVMNVLRVTVFLCCAYACVQTFSIHDALREQKNPEPHSLNLFFQAEDIPAQRPNETIYNESNANSESSEACECVHCDSDKRCGGLWTGNVVGREDDRPTFDKVTLVVSHCLHDLDWMTNYTKGFNISKIIVFSKCGKKVDGAPKDSAVVQLPNVGRNDHTYARYMNKIYDKKISSNEAIVFLKDDLDDSNIKFPGRWRSLHEVLLIAEKQQFACGLELELFGHFQISTYHSTDILKDFALSDYDVGLKKYDTQVDSDQEPFRSDFANLGQYQREMKYSLPVPLTQVCYGGYFATTRGAIQHHPQSLWKSLEDSLARANNLEEGHYVERSWAGLLANPIADYQIRALQEYSTETMEHGYNEFLGALIAPRPLHTKKEISARVMARYTAHGKWSSGTITSVEGETYSVVFDKGGKLTTELSDSDVKTEYEASKWIGNEYQDFPRDNGVLYSNETETIGNIPSFPFSWVHLAPRPLHDAKGRHQRVMAVVPSDGKYHWGYVSSMQGDFYRIRFDDGSKAGKLKDSDVKTEVEASAWLLHVMSKRKPDQAFQPKFSASEHQEEEKISAM